jgi:3-oxoadipate enol-lactonase
MQERWLEVRAGDVRLAVRDVAGPGPNAPALLLHHGLASSQHIWDLMLPTLARRYRVVTYDARGHGGSSKPSRGYGFAQVAGDALAVIRSRCLRRPVAVGHSWGAMTVLDLAVRSPRSVAGVVLVDGGVTSLSDRMSWLEARGRLSPPHLTGMPVEEFRRLIPSFFDGALDVTPEIERIVLSVMQVRRDGTIRPHLHRSNHLRILRAIWEQDPVALHARLGAPALAILARGADPQWDAAKCEAADALTGTATRISWVQGIHDLPLQHPLALARRITRFADACVP